MKVYILKTMIICELQGRGLRLRFKAKTQVYDLNLRL
jgi:hypothetical protein